VQALIFTGITQAIVLAFRETLLLLGNIYSIGAWTEGSSFVTSIILAIFVGICFSIFANKNWLHKRLWKWGRLTQRTSYPSEWYSALTQEQRYVVLHLDGDRRLCGWPCEWPDHSDSGHFVLINAAWILDDGTEWWSL
jgi:hypothetical protein